MEITKEYNKQTKKALDDYFDREIERVTLYYEIGWVTFENGFTTVLNKPEGEIWEHDAEQLIVSENYDLLYNGKRYLLDEFGVTL